MKSDQECTASPALLPFELLLEPLLELLVELALEPVVVEVALETCVELLVVPDLELDFFGDTWLWNLRMMMLACSARPKVEPIKCAEKEMGGTLASATRTLERP